MSIPLSTIVRRILTDVSGHLMLDSLKIEFFIHRHSGATGAQGTHRDSRCHQHAHSRDDERLFETISKCGVDGLDNVVLDSVAGPIPHDDALGGRASFD